MKQDAASAPADNDADEEVEDGAEGFREAKSAPAELPSGHGSIAYKAAVTALDNLTQNIERAVRRGAVPACP
jgi:hypothetical protein